MFDQVPKKELQHFLLIVDKIDIGVVEPAIVI